MSVPSRVVLHCEVALMDDVDRSFSDDVSRRAKVRVHVAGVLRDAVQRCIRCGQILSDYRGAAVLKGSRPLTGFAVGAAVAVQGGGKWVTGAKLDPNETPCDLFERN